METVITALRNSSIPMALVACGLACMILAIASEIPPAAGEERLLYPRKAVPLTGMLLLLLGVPLSMQWPVGLFPLERLIAYMP